MSKRLKTSSYDPITSISTATIVTELGEFQGGAKLHPDDRGVSSAYFGCFLAELRANIKYFKVRKQYIKAQRKGLIDFEKVIKSHKAYNKDTMEASKLRRQIAEKTEAINNCDKTIAHLRDVCKREEERRLRLVDKIRN